MVLDQEIANKIFDEYFEWMFNLVCEDRFSKDISYRKLLTYLHEKEFIPSLPRDENRAEDGMDLRYRFAILHCYEDELYYLDGPCSMLEMMVALALRCEESIMDDPAMGNRTGQWFWGMIANLGLGDMVDERFDIHRADRIINRFLRRDYEPNGKGGLFTVRNCKRDLRNVEIWYQLCWYLDTIM